MITEIVSFKVPTGTSRSQILEDAKTTIDRWWKFPGLVRKTYVRGEDDIVMGIYLWESKDAAQTGHNEEWLNRAETKWGNRPQISYFDTVMVLDNRHEEILDYPDDAQV